MINLQQIVMYKPSLKRTTLTKDTQPTINTSLIANLYRYQPSKQKVSSHVMVPSKILETPQNRNKDKHHLFAPLLIKSHKYPKGVSQQLKSEAPSDCARGVGGYREINWLFQGKTLTLWITDKDNEIEIAMDENISAVAMGELKAQYLPSKIKNRYIVAVGCLDTVSLFSLNNFTLKTYETGVKYKIRHSLQVQNIKFIQERKLLVGSNTGMVELIEFGQRQSIKRLEMPYYRYIVPVTSEETTIKIQQLIYSKSKIYALMTQINPKSWIRSLWEGLLSQASVPYTTTRYIQVFQVGATIVKKQKIFENELSQKIKNYIPTWKSQICIKSIYIDRQNSQDQELGIATECGCFLTLRVTNYSLSREPLFVFSINQLEQCRFMTQKKFEPVSFTSEETKNYNRKVVSSLGYQNLTLLDDSLLWIGEERIDGVLSTQIIGEIYEKREYQSSHILEKNREWGLFDFKNYYTIEQMPIRQFIATLFYIKNNLSNEYLGLHYTEEKFNAFLERYVKTFSPEIFLKYLIEIVISQERFLTINPYFIELIEGELRDQKVKDFKDWKHELTPSVKTQQIFLNEHILNHIWSMILQMQYREILNYPSKFINLYESNVFWLTIHQLYHSLISPLYHMNPQDFRNNKTMIEDIALGLESVGAFFAKKELYERCIRQSLINKSQKKDIFNSLDNTSSSFLGQQELAWIPESVKRSIAGRAINQNYQILQGKIQQAFKATAILIKIYFNIEDYTFTKDGKEVKRHSKLIETTFKEVLSSKQLQKYIKKQLLARLQYKDLYQLDKNLPCFNLEQDLRYLRCIKKIKLEKLPKDQLDLQEIAEAITSDYFQEIDSVFEKRYDMKLKTLGLYQERLLREKQGLVKSNTLQQRSIINKTFFPEDEQEMLKFRRSHLDKELQLALEEQKKCISAAIHAHAVAKVDNVHNLATVIDQIIIHISDKSYLLPHTEQELRKASLIRQLSQLQRIKPRSMPGVAFPTQVKIKPQFLRRDLFPPPF